METENKDWKPRVGEPAWVIDRRGNTPRIVHAIISITHELQHPPRVDCWIHGWGWVEAFESPEAALASIRVYDLEGKEVVVPRARSIFDGKGFNWMARDEEGQSERVGSVVKWDAAGFPQKDPNEKTWENVVKAYSIFKEARMGHQEFYQYMDSQLDELILREKYIHAMIILNEGGGAATGGKSDQREGGC